MKEKGITLIALIVTIIVLIILAGITIATITGDDGIINNANNAKEETEIANEKEIVDRATVQAMGNNKRGNIVKDELQDELDRITKVGDTEVEDNGEEFEVVFVNTQRYYTVNKDGDIIEEGKIVIDKSPGDITKDENGNDIKEGQPYEIWCIEDLVAFSNMVNGNGIILENGKAIEIDTPTNFSNKTVELKTNLNFKSKHSYANSERTDFGDINGNENDGNTLINEMSTGTGFKPIGLDRGFNGEFNGENNKINNLYINYENDTVLDGYNIGRFVGLFSKGNNVAIIKNLTVSGEIKGKGHAGGIIGEGAKLIENCTNNANVTGYNMVGGIVGNNSQLLNCTNTGNVNNITGRAWSHGGTGGIVGNTSYNIENCVNYGTVSGVTIIGGILGYNGSEKTINNCSNYGNVVLTGTSTQSSAGGIVGKNASKIEINNSFNQGNTEGKGTTGGIGGIIGLASSNDWTTNIESNINNCFNTGIIKYNDYNDISGGIVGQQGNFCATNYINIENCWSIGNNNNFGGIIGIISKAKTETKTQRNNSYYISTKAIVSNNNDTNTVNSAIQKKEKEIKSQEFVNILNQNIGENTLWKKWKLGENGYPTFE